MLVQQYLIDENHQLGNEKEKISNIFSVIDKLETQHLIFVKQVFDKETFKLKAFVISFNETSTKVNQVELARDLNIEKVLSFLEKEQLLNQKIETNMDEMIQDMNYIYHLSKRYSLTERNHPVLKKAILNTMNPKHHLYFENTQDVLSDFLLKKFFPFYRYIGFVTDINQLQHLPKNELKNLLTKNIYNITLIDKYEFLNGFKEKLIEKQYYEQYVQRIDISPFTLFEKEESVKSFLSSLKPIPYTDKTECHFYLDKDYLINSLNNFAISLDDFLLKTYEETVVVEESLRYVCFVEQLKEMQNLFKKFDTLKEMEVLYEKEVNELKEKMNELSKEDIHAFSIVELLKKIEKNIASLNVNYPTLKLDNWLRLEEFYTIDNYTVKGIVNHQEFNQMTLKYFVLHKQNFIFKDVDVDYIVFTKEKDEIILEIKADAYDTYQVQHIYSNKEQLDFTEKEMIELFCLTNHIKCITKKHPYLR